MFDQIDHQLRVQHLHESIVNRVQALTQRDDQPTVYRIGYGLPNQGAFYAEPYDFTHGVHTKKYDIVWDDRAQPVYEVWEIMYFCPDPDDGYLIPTALAALDCTRDDMRSSEEPF